MKTEREIYNTIKWDPRYDETLFVIEFAARGEANRQVPFLQFNPHGDIPWHRIKRFYYGETLVWDRENRFEDLELVYSALLRYTLKKFDLNKRSIKMKTEDGGFAYNKAEKRWERGYNLESSVTALDKMTFLSFNVLCDTYEGEKTYSSLRYPKLVTWLKDRADLIQLQEVTPHFLSLLMKEEWVRHNYYLSDISETLWQPFAVVTLSRYPMARVSHLYINPGKRPALLSELRIHDETLNMVNLHLSSNRRGGVDGRRNEILTLLSILKEFELESTMLSGDFNFNDESEGRWILKEGYIDLDSYFYGDRVCNTFDPDKNTLARELSPMATARRMDRIYLKSPAAHMLPAYLECIEDVEFPEGRFLSDHFPLYGEMDISVYDEMSNTLKAARGMVSLCVKGYSPLPLVQTEGPLYFTLRIRDLLSTSVTAVIREHPLEEGDFSQFSTEPKNWFLILTSMILSVLKGTSMSENYIGQKIASVTDCTNPGLLSSLIDENGNSWALDYYSFTYKLEQQEGLPDVDSNRWATEVISELCEKHSLKLIGSYLLGAALEDSDMDFYSGDNPESLSKILSSLYDIRIVGERSRNIKFSYKGFQIDIQFDAEAYRQNLELYKVYENSDERRKLLHFIKRWARQRNIHRQAFGYPGGSAWALLVAGLEDGNLSLNKFFKKANVLSLPPSYTELYTESSLSVLRFEFSRAAALMESGNVSELFEERHFDSGRSIRLKLSDEEGPRFISLYLRLSREVEKKAGLADVIRNKSFFELFLFDVNAPQRMLETFLSKHQFADYEFL